MAKRMCIRLREYYVGSRSLVHAKGRHAYRAEPKEPTQFGSVSGSEIQNVPFSHSGIVSLYQSEPEEPT